MIFVEIKNRYGGLDSLKALCAFMVICIHVPFIFGPGKYYLDLTRFAVPCFFMISGFFYPRTIEKKGELKQIIRIARLCLISFALFLVWTRLFYHISGQDFTYVTDRLTSFNGLVKLLVFNNAFVAFHLWYVFAFLYVLIISLIACALKLKKLLFGVSPLLLLTGIVLGNYSGPVLGGYITIDLARNAYFFGLPFFCLGWFIAENRDKICSAMSKKLLIILIVVSTATQLLEHLLIEKAGFAVTGDIYLTTALCAASVFLFFLMYVKGDGAMATIGRKYSTGIYLVHPVIIDILGHVISKTQYLQLYFRVSPLIVFFLSLGLVVLWKKLAVRKKAT